MDDKEIIALFLARDEGAIQAAQRQYGGYCAAIANGILDDRGAAEECVNDTWLKCWQSIPPQHPRSLKGFAGRIARNLALSVRRADMAQKRGGGQTALALDELSEVVSGGETPEGAMDRQALRAALDGFLAGLPVPAAVLVSGQRGAARQAVRHEQDPGHHHAPPPAAEAAGPS